MVKQTKIKARKEELARLKAEKKEQLRLRREAEAKRKEQARLKEEQERKAKEEKLANLQAQKEAQEQACKEKLAKLQAEKEEGLRLKREEKDRRREQKRLSQERKAKESALKRAQAKLVKQTKIKARKEELARLKAEKKEQLRLRREAEAKRKEQAHLKEEQERKAKEEKLANLKAEKEKRQKVLQEKIELHYNQGKRHFQNRDYIAARKEFKDILFLDPKNRYALNALEKVNATEARQEREYKHRQEEKEAAESKKRKETINEHLAQGKIYLHQEKYQKAIEEFGKILFVDPNNSLAEKQILHCKEKLAEAKAKEEARLKEEQEGKARQERLTRLKAEKEAELLRIKAEREERLADLKTERQAQERARQEKLVRLQAEKKEQLRLRREAEAKAEEEARLKEEQEGKAKEEKPTKLKAEKEEKSAKEAQQHRGRQKLRLHLAQGKIHYYREQYEQAIEEFKQVLLIDPEYSLAGEYIRKCQKGIEEQEQKELLAKEKKAGRLKKTAKLIKEQEEEEKLKKIKELYEKGKSYFRRGLYSEATACFEEVIELEGNPRIYYTPQAKEYVEQAGEKIEEKKKEDAQKIAAEEIKRRKAQEAQKLEAKERAEKEAQEKEEEIIRGRYQSGKKYYRQRNYPMAIAEFNKIEEINPQHSYVTFAERYIEKCQQKIMQTEEIELKAELKRETQASLKGKEIQIKKDESLSENLLTQARWYYKRGNYEQAIKICRAVLELDHLNKEARNLLYKAELKQIRDEQKQADKEVGIDEKDMLAEVAKTQVLPEEKVIPVPEKEFMPIVKVPAIREKLKNPITVDFRDVDLNYVLNFLADSCAVNIIPASGVSLEGKKVSIKMKDMPAENALKYILKNQGLTYRIEEDAVWVASPSEMDKEEVESRVYFLNRGSGMFAEFERMVGTGTGLGGAPSIKKITTLKDILEEAVDWPKDSKLVLDERSGALVITNTPSNFQVIEDILYNLDITPMQVLIETRFVELQVTDVEQLGIEWQLTAALGDKRRDGNNVTQWESGSGWDFAAFTEYASEGLNLAYTGVLTYPEFQMVLHALAETKNAKTLSSPRITTLNNQMATIKVVDEWIYPTRYEFQTLQEYDAAGNISKTVYKNVPVDFVTKDIGILLHVTPNIGADGKTITLALVPEVSEGKKGEFSYEGGVSLPMFSSRTLSTSVVINNGDTVALGGLVKESTSKTTTKIPLLGDIPILGYLFRKQNDSIVRKNLLIFVTATIISPSGEMIETVQQP